MQTDFDGKFQYSAIVTVTINVSSTSPTMIYPNPVRDFTNIIPSSSFVDKEIIFEIFDLQGKKVYGTRTSDMESVHEHVFVFRRGELRAGIYFYRLGNSGGLVETGKLVLK